MFSSTFESMRTFTGSPLVQHVCGPGFSVSPRLNSGLSHQLEDKERDYKFTILSMRKRERKSFQLLGFWSWAFNIRVVRDLVLCLVARALDPFIFRSKRSPKFQALDWFHFEHGIFEKYGVEMQFWRPNARAIFINCKFRALEHRTNRHALPDESKTRKILITVSALNMT